MISVCSGGEEGIPSNQERDVPWESALPVCACMQEGPKSKAEVFVRERGLNQTVAGLLWM